MIDARSEEKKQEGPQIEGEDRSMEFDLLEDQVQKIHGYYQRMFDNNVFMVNAYSRREDIERKLKSLQSELSNINKQLPQRFKEQHHLEKQFKDAIVFNVIKQITPEQRENIEGSADDMVDEAINFGLSFDFLSKKVNITSLPKALFRGLTKKPSKKKK